MKTEREIIYTMQDTVLAGEINNDELLTERYWRNLLRKYRPDSLRKLYSNGKSIAEEVIQQLDITLTYVEPSVYTGQLPKIIRFNGQTGFYIHINGFSIPITTPQKYFFGRKNWNSKHMPVGKTEGQKVTIFIGDDTSPYLSEPSMTRTAIEAMKNQTIINPEKGALKLTLAAVLHNPSDDPNYNWETDVYPFPSERIRELTDQIMLKEFGITMQAKPDEVQNTRQDKIRYHDQDDVSQN